MSTNDTNKINKYYQNTAWDYKHLWRTDALAIHFGYYDETIREHKKALLKMNEVMASFASIESGEHVVDAGCGVGGSSIWLAENLGCYVTGINIVQEQLAEAVDFAKTHQVEKLVKFVNSDYTRLPLADKSQDVFWALESMVHAKDKNAIIKEASRILKNNGKIVLAEYMLREKPELNQKEQEYLNPWLSGWAMPSLYTTSQYEQVLSARGFTNIKILNVSKNITPSLQRLRLMCLFLLPGAMIMRFLRLFTKGRVANIKSSLRQIAAFRGGLWRYIIITARKHD